MPLQGVDTQHFLDTCWQRKTTVLRAALADFVCPIDGDDLAGLACEEDVDSRLIVQEGQEWLLRHGPFGDADFGELPADKWTLLVQSVDQWIPEIASLLADFRFIPRWRIDDIMVSYASHGGSVGPHFDQYDVFLIQGNGQRRWKLGQHCDDSSPALNHPDLRLLRDFDEQEEVVLSPGDILYIPPGVAHWGIAEGDDCITLSVGFRAPSEAELLNSWSADRETVLDDSERFRDLPLRADAHSARLPTELAGQLREILTRGLEDDQALLGWFGKTMTEVNPAQLFSNAPLTAAEFSEQLKTSPLSLRPGCRLAFDDHQLFIDGLAYPYPADYRDVISQFCLCEGEIPGGLLATLPTQLLHNLYQAGSVYFDDDSNSEY